MEFLFFALVFDIYNLLFSINKTLRTIYYYYNKVFIRLFNTYVLWYVI